MDIHVSTYNGKYKTFVFYCKQNFKKTKQCLLLAGNLNTGFYAIVTLVTNSLFMVFLGKKLQGWLLPVEALQDNCTVIR